MFSSNFTVLSFFALVISSRTLHGHEENEDFQHEIKSLLNYDSHGRSIAWIHLFGNPAKSANEIAASHEKASLVEQGEAYGKLTDLVFRDPGNLEAGELRNNYCRGEFVCSRSFTAWRYHVPPICFAPFYSGWTSTEILGKLRETLHTCRHGHLSKEILVAHCYGEST